MYHLPYSLSISVATQSVSSDCCKIVQSTLNLLESSLTTLDSAFNAPSVKKPLDLSNSSNITSSVYNICITSIGRTYCERLSECFSSVSFVSSFWTTVKLTK